MKTTIFENDWSFIPIVDGSSSIDKVFSVDILLKAYFTKISKKASRGIDGTTLKNFDIKDEVSVISKKCASGKYKFTPYLQRLQLKGKGKYPREISIPTIRDQLVLFALKEYLHLIFTDCVNITLPNKYIRDIRSYLESEADNETLCYSKYDITDFYGSLDHDFLISALKSKIKSQNIVDLIVSAINNITVPSTAKKINYKSYKSKGKKGIPQGLSISNILANIYIKGFDTNVSEAVPRYFRYVDDILIFNKGENKQCIKPSVESSLKELGLTAHESKTICKSNKVAFDYLGYHFDFPKISIRQSNVDSFINSIAGKFTSFKSKKHMILRNHKWLTSELYQQVFIEELNLRITGAVTEKKRYGWVFYFIEMNDLTLLKMIDNVILKFIKENSDFGGKIPENLKTLCRTYFEARHNPFGTYIHNYDKYVTTQEKLDYLIKMGKIDKNYDQTLSVEQIDILFDQTKAYYLSLLDLDIGGFS